MNWDRALTPQSDGNAGPKVNRRPSSQNRDVGHPGRMDALTRAFSSQLNNDLTEFEARYGIIDIEFDCEDLGIAPVQMDAAQQNFNATQLILPAPPKSPRQTPRFNFALFLEFIGGVSVRMRGYAANTKATIVFNDGFWQGSQILITHDKQTLNITWQAANSRVYDFLTKRKKKLEEFIGKNMDQPVRITVNRMRPQLTATDDDPLTDAAI